MSFNLVVIGRRSPVFRGGLIERTPECWNTQAGGLRGTKDHVHVNCRPT